MDLTDLLLIDAHIQAERSIDNRITLNKQDIKDIRVAIKIKSLEHIPSNMLAKLEEYIKYNKLS